MKHMRIILKEIWPVSASYSVICGETAKDKFQNF